MIYLTALVVAVAMVIATCELCSKYANSYYTYQRVMMMGYIIACTAVLAWLVYILQTFTQGGLS